MRNEPKSNASRMAVGQRDSTFLDGSPRAKRTQFPLLRNGSGAAATGCRSVKRLPAFSFGQLGFPPPLFRIIPSAGVLFGNSGFKIGGIVGKPSGVLRVAFSENTA